MHIDEEKKTGAKLIRTSPKGRIRIFFFLGNNDSLDFFRGGDYRPPQDVGFRYIVVTWNPETLRGSSNRIRLSQGGPGSKGPVWPVFSTTSQTFSIEVYEDDFFVIRETIFSVENSSVSKRIGVIYCSVEPVKTLLFQRKIDFKANS